MIDTFAPVFRTGRLALAASLVVAVGAAALAHLSANVGLLLIWTSTALAIGAALLGAEAFGMRRLRTARRLSEIERMSAELRVARADVLEEEDPTLGYWDCMPRPPRGD